MLPKVGINGVGAGSAMRTFRRSLGHMFALMFLSWGAFSAFGTSPGLASDKPAYQAWLKELKADARDAGISDETIESALGDLALAPDVVELDRKQPETRQTFEKYRSRVLSDTRVKRGRELLKEHRSLLNKIAADYNVQPRFIVALWGVETSYGSFLGGHKVIQALATLAYDGRRADLFRRELISALRILDRGDIELEDMKGSWAGAMGQSQFMPSSFLRYMPLTMMVTVGATSGTRYPMFSPRSRTTSPRPAGTHATPGEDQSSWPLPKQNGRRVRG